MRRLLAVVLVVAPRLALAQVGDVERSHHNLSVSGPGPIKATSETQICVFCHVGHHGTALGSNRPYSTAAYSPYASSTMTSPAPGAPSGSTRLCLSCHDGTIAVGETLASGRIDVGGTDSAGRMPTGASNLGTDLRRTHPVSFRPASSPTLTAPPPGGPVRLDRDGEVQCTSCHDPHKEDVDPVVNRFLVTQNRGSALCQSCHSPSGWSTGPAAHQSSLAPVAGLTTRTLPYSTVADNGCGSCHTSHDASSSGRLVARGDTDADDKVCMDCHTGAVAKLDLRPDYAKPYNHAVGQGGVPVHDASERPSSSAFPLPETSSTAPRHAACVDCHDPHAANETGATPPQASGLLAGVWGVSRLGAAVSPVQYQYEVCFKCHADSANQPQAKGPTPPDTLRRAVTDVNLRHVLDPSAPSFHPVEGPGKGTDVPSLLSPWTTASQVQCTDCHASDSGPGAGGTGPRGPHGSIYRHLLERNYVTADNTAESPTAYAMCYKCHDRSVVISSGSAFPLHNRHVVQQSAPCSACHASHGVSALAGNAVNNAHLVDFDVSIVKPNAKGVLQYSSQGGRSGSCSLSCHGVDHDGRQYTPATAP